MHGPCRTWIKRTVSLYLWVLSPFSTWKGFSGLGRNMCRWSRPFHIHKGSFMFIGDINPTHTQPLNSWALLLRARFLHLEKPLPCPGIKSQPLAWKPAILTSTLPAALKCYKDCIMHWSFIFHKSLVKLTLMTLHHMFYGCIGRGIVFCLDICTLEIWKCV